MQNLSIIIVSWNALRHLKEYIPSVWEASHQHAEIIIADNASEDGSKEWLRRHYPGIKVIELDKNYGYCGGNNRAAYEAKGDYVLFLNNDVRVTAGWLIPLIDFMDKNPNMAAVQPKIQSDVQPGLFEYAGAAGGFLDRHGFPFCRGRIFDITEKDSGQYDNPGMITWASGAAILTRKDLFLAHGGFDETFEFHMEEIDYCWRLINLGYDIGYCPNATVYHLGGGSLPADSPRKRYYNYRNNLKMLFKNLSRRKLFTTLPVRLFLDNIATIRSLFRLEYKEALAMIRGKWHFYRSIPQLLAYRTSVTSRYYSQSGKALKPYSILWHYFIRKKKAYSELPDSGN